MHIWAYVLVEARCRAGEEASAELGPQLHQILNPQTRLHPQILSLNTLERLELHEANALALNPLKIKPPKPPSRLLGVEEDLGVPGVFWLGLAAEGRKCQVCQGLEAVFG